MDAAENDRRDRAETHIRTLGGKALDHELEKERERISAFEDHRANLAEQLVAEPMSPPSRFGPRQYSGQRGLTPVHTTTTEASPGESSESGLGTRRSLTPVPFPARNVGTEIRGYKCEHPGCTAPPFQTQYLLK